MTIPLQKYASGKSVALLLLLMVVFNVLLMGSLTGGQENIEPIDLQFAYTPDRAYELLDSYTAETRKSYIIGELTLDIAYPITYTLMISFSLFLLYNRNPKLGLLPYSILISDILENTGIVTMLANYPDKLLTIAWITSFFSTLKWLMVMVCFALLLIGLVKKLILKK